MHMRWKGPKALQSPRGALYMRIPGVGATKRFRQALLCQIFPESPITTKRGFIHAATADQLTHQMCQLSVQRQLFCITVYIMVSYKIDLLAFCAQINLHFIGLWFSKYQNLPEHHGHITYAKISPNLGIEGPPPQPPWDSCPALHLLTPLGLNLNS